MPRFYISLIALMILSRSVTSQALLQADGPGETYELINSVLAPGFDVVEAPDCNHESFGRHIDEIFDEELNTYVFRFFLHTEPDNDRCQTFDRQRNEIKTYSKSPDDLLGVLGEEVVYKWKFKIDEDFQSSTSFTHLHQIKAVGGAEESTPTITLTARKANPDRLELRYAEAFDQVTLDQIELDDLKGIWLEVTETIFYGEADSGSYDLEIRQWSNGNLLFGYQTDSIRMWKTDADFLRPKWGIYRSLNDANSLRDESVLFADFSIEELDKSVEPIDTTTTVLSLPHVLNELDVYPNPVLDQLNFSDYVVSTYSNFVLYNNVGKVVSNHVITTNSATLDNLPNGLYFAVFSSGLVISTPYKILKR